MKDIRDEISNTIKTRTVAIGYNTTVESLLNGQPTTVFASSRIPLKMMNDIKYYTKVLGIPLEVIDVDTLELGSICNRSYPVSVLAVLEDKG
ncbi:MAG: ribosomal L7Ae/L30e/S12e/Gadd45 family protein [Candidatus Altiarchaeota archaeon]